MSKNQKGRIIENLAYGLPIMPFSDTADGRIVAMQKKSIEQNQKFQEVTKYHQADLLKGLTGLYGKNEVPINEFNSKLPDVARILNTHTNLHYEKLNAINNVADINTEGFQQVSGNLENINSSISNQTGVLNQGLSNVVKGSKDIQETLRTGFTGLEYSVESTGRILGRELKGPKMAVTSVNNYLSLNSSDNLKKMIAGIKQGVVKQHVIKEVIDFISEKYGWVLNNEKKVNAYRNIRANFKKLENNNGEFLRSVLAKGENYYDVSKFIDKPSEYIITNINSLDKVKSVISSLYNLSNSINQYKKTKLPSLNNLNPFINSVYSFIKTYINTSIDVKKTDLVYYVNNGYLLDGASHQVKEIYRDARKEGTLVDINFNVADINNQLDTTNSYLNNIATVVSQQNEHSVNLTRLTEEYIRVSTNGFNTIDHSINQGFSLTNENLEEINENIEILNDNVVSGFQHTIDNLKQLQKIVTMVGLKLVDEIQFWSKNIINEISFTNQLLQQIIELNINSLKVEAKQRLEQGLFLLQINDFEDAFISFTDGIKEDKTNPYLYYSAGFSLEMQNKIEKAIEYYKKASTRAQGSNDLIYASVSMQKIARLYYFLKDYDNVITYLSLAIELNQKNITAKFELAKALTEEAKYNQSKKIILELIGYDNKFLKLIKQDNSFQTMPFENILKNLVDKNIIKNEKILIDLLIDFLTLKNKEYALTLNNILINNGIPYQYLKLKIWENPSFITIKEDFINFLRSKNNRNSLSSFRNQRYSASFLLFYLDFSEKEIANCFIEELNNDKYKLYEDSSKVIEQLNRIDKENSEKLINKISKYLSIFKWLKF